MVRSAQDVALHPQHGEVGRLGARELLVAGLDVHGADAPAADLAGETPADVNRNHPAAIEADPPAVEQRRRVRAGLAEPTAGAAAGEVEVAAPLEEEVALLGQEQAEPGEVHLLLVHLDLREVGVHGEVGGDVGRHAVLEIAAELRVEVAAHRRHPEVVGRRAAERIGLDLHVARRRRQVQAHQRAIRRHAVEGHRTGQVLRHRAQVVPFVLAADGAPHLEPPHHVGARGVADRLERDGDLQRPAALEAAGAGRPHRVPVGVGRAFVDDGIIGEAAERVRVEHEAAAPVVEGVERHADVVVVPHLVGVAPQLVGHPLLGRRRIVDPRRHVDVAIVVGDPDVGALGGQLAVPRDDLDEVAERLVVDIGPLVEAAIVDERLGQLDRADGRPPIGVPGDAGGSDGRRRAVQMIRDGRGLRRRPAPATAPPTWRREARAGQPRSWRTRVAR